ncbi:MAG: ERCC4 domain-containing protein [bacterium]
MEVLPYRYTKKERKGLLNSLTILVDSREQKNQHITSYFEDKGVPYKNKKLDWGDYSFMLPAAPEAGIMRDIYFNRHDIAIERKRSLNELSNNFTHDRTQFENELIRAGRGKFILLIENEQGYKNIIKHNYRTNYKPRSYIGTLHSFRHRYDMEVMFIDPAFSGNFIYYTFYYYCRECLK